MRTLQKFGGARYVSRLVEHSAAFDAVEETETALLRDVTAMLRAEAHGVIWPSVVVSRERDADGTTISVRGLAYRFTGSAA